MTWPHLYENTKIASLKCVPTSLPLPMVSQLGVSSYITYLLRGSKQGHEAGHGQLGGSTHGKEL